MDGGSRPQDHELMRLNPRQGLRGAASPRAAGPRGLPNGATGSPTEAVRWRPRLHFPQRRGRAGRARRGHDCQEVVALEPLVRRARSVLGIDRTGRPVVRIAERWIPWADVGGSYAGVVAAFCDCRSRASPDQRDVGVSPWDGRGRGLPGTVARGAAGGHGAHFPTSRPRGASTRPRPGGGLEPLSGRSWDRLPATCRCGSRAGPLAAWGAVVAAAAVARHPDPNSRATRHQHRRF